MLMRYYAPKNRNAFSRRGRTRGFTLESFPRRVRSRFSKSRASKRFGSVMVAFSEGGKARQLAKCPSKIRSKFGRRRTPSYASENTVPDLSSHAAGRAAIGVELRQVFPA
jgi:hypothetical protein